MKNGIKYRFLIFSVIILIVLWFIYSGIKKRSETKNSRESDFLLGVLVRPIPDSLLLSNQSYGDRFVSVPQIDYLINAPDYYCYKKKYSTFFVDVVDYIPGERSTSILKYYQNNSLPIDKFTLIYGIETLSYPIIDSIEKNKQLELQKEQFNDWTFIVGYYYNRTSNDIIIKSIFHSNNDFFLSSIYRYIGNYKCKYRFLFDYSIHSRHFQKFTISKNVELEDSSDVKSEIQKFEKFIYRIRFRKNKIPFSTKINFDSLKSEGYENIFKEFLP